MKLLLTGAFKYNDNHYYRLKEIGYKITFVQDERIPLQMDVSEFEGVICNNLFSYNDIKKFNKLKFIQLTSAGLDRVPLNYIKEQGIKLYNAKDVYSISMAEWVVLKILEIYKRSDHFYKSQFQRKWEKERNLFELTDKTATIIGFGSVGSEVAKRLKAFDVNVIGVGRREIKSNLVDKYYKIEQLDEALSNSDIVILTIPLTRETTHLIDANKMRKMKANSVLINVSRGGIIDQQSLIEYLQRNKSFRVALDVFEEEPLSEENELWTLDNVIITPHNSYISNKVNDRLFELIVRNLKSNLC